MVPEKKFFENYSLVRGDPPPRFGKRPDFLLHFLATFTLDIANNCPEYVRGDGWCLRLPSRRGFYGAGIDKSLEIENILGGNYPCFLSRVGEFNFHFSICARFQNDEKILIII